MVSLAVGELLMLSRSRRTVLVTGAILHALFSDLGRTFYLSWVTEHGGAEAMHKVHDMAGNVAMYSLYILIWVLGKFLEGRSSLHGRPDSPIGVARWAASVGIGCSTSGAWRR